MRPLIGQELGPNWPASRFLIGRCQSPSRERTSPNPAVSQGQQTSVRLWFLDMELSRLLTGELQVFG